MVGWLDGWVSLAGEVSLGVRLEEKDELKEGRRSLKSVGMSSLSIVVLCFFFLLAYGLHVGWTLFECVMCRCSEVSCAAVVRSPKVYRYKDV